VITLTALDAKEGRDENYRCDLHARQQTLAMLDTETGEVVNLTLMHEGNNVREFYFEASRGQCL